MCFRCVSLHARIMSSCFSTDLTLDFHCSPLVLRAALSSHCQCQDDCNLRHLPADYRQGAHAGGKQRQPGAGHDCHYLPRVAHRGHCRPLQGRVGANRQVGDCVRAHVYRQGKAGRSCIVVPPTAVSTAVRNRLGPKFELMIGGRYLIYLRRMRVGEPGLRDKIHSALYFNGVLF